MKTKQYCCKFQWNENFRDCRREVKWTVNIPETTAVKKWW